ncbi:hypothetical protein [Entomospira culicis]|uniref:Uncharacterized protein n=1 Tax=Entomospira culicis TaxID=2719989 RepID=A0A968GG08_9SPIO|nr:hypothetical protein [Entomospira culicis]NIZ19159.1 hypothetical protein [Entomospira culicis]NIZ69373.1 hypothetical protein [Entomospira culicis]WDI36490.1 hypothetical protein PVA46_03985 [Entomospira culicis]WDI38116.1 hypothetical protein PVA47_03985 [Entomospira culicis]
MSAKTMIESFLSMNNVGKIDEIGTSVINNVKPISNDILSTISKRTYDVEKQQLTSVNDQAREALASLEAPAPSSEPSQGLIPKFLSKLGRTLFTGEAPTVAKAELKAIDITNNLENMLYKVADNLKVDEKDLMKFNAAIEKAISDLDKINMEVRSVIEGGNTMNANEETWSSLLEKNADLTTQVGVFKTITLSIENQLKINRNLQRSTKKSINQILPIWRSVVANSLSSSSLNEVAESAKQTNEALDMFLEKSINQQQELASTVRELEQSKLEMPRKIASYLDVLNEIQNEIEDIYIQSEKDRMENTKMLQDKLDFLNAKTIDVEVEEQNPLL